MEKEQNIHSEEKKDNKTELSPTEEKNKESEKEISPEDKLKNSKKN